MNLTKFEYFGSVKQEIAVKGQAVLEIVSEGVGKLTIQELSDFKALFDPFSKETRIGATYSLIAIGENIKIVPPGAINQLPYIFSRELSVDCGEIKES